MSVQNIRSKKEKIKIKKVKTVMYVKNKNCNLLKMESETIMYIK